METYEKLYKTICRVCLGHSDNENMVSLIDNDKENGLSCYGEVVLTFADVFIKSDDYFPKVMCTYCLFILKQAISFKLKCESSHKQLKELVENSDVSEQNFMEKIVQYTMFTNYFPDSTILKPTKRVKSADKPEKLTQKLEETSNNITMADQSNNKTEEYTDIDEDHLKMIDYSDTEQSTNVKSEDLLDKLEQLVGMGSTKSSKELSNINLRRNFKMRKLKYRKIIKRRRLLRPLNTTKTEDLSENLICGICQRVLANQHTYDHHMQRHKGCRYMCEHCAKGFPVLAELQRHQIARHGTGPYLQCQHCSFKAPRKFDLIEHERIHTGERPYACDKCGLTFRRRGIWKKHLIYHMEKKIQCPQCSKRFYQRSDMLAHANNVHERVYVYLCNKCGATYAKPATVRRHLTERHGIPREMQGKVIRVNKGRGTDFPEQ